MNLDVRRLNAETDLSNILHIQSTLPSSTPRPAPVRHQVPLARREEALPDPGHLEEAGQLSMAEDDMFALDGVLGELDRDAGDNAVSDDACTYSDLSPQPQ